MDVEEEIEKTWGYGSYDTYFVILPKSVIDEVEPLYRLRDCTTWGDVADLGEELMEEVLGLAGYGSFEEYTAHLNITGAVPLPGAGDIMAENYDPDAEVPGPDEPFSLNDIPSAADGDFPPSLLLLMSEHVPYEVREAYGSGYDTNFNGYFTEFDIDAKDDVLAWFTQAGFTVEPSTAIDDMLSPWW